MSEGGEPSAPATPGLIPLSYTTPWNAAEGKIGQGKRRFGLGLIRDKLAIIQGSTIALNVLAMKLEKLLELLFVFLQPCYAFFWSMNAVGVFAQCL
jgi:hypothetical protein